MVKTSINLPGKLWRDFNISVTIQYGQHKTSEVMRDLIKSWMEVHPLHIKRDRTPSSYHILRGEDDEYGILRL